MKGCVPGEGGWLQSGDQTHLWAGSLTSQTTDIWTEQQTDATSSALESRHQRSVLAMNACASPLSEMGFLSWISASLFLKKAPVRDRD